MKVVDIKTKVDSLQEKMIDAPPEWMRDGVQAMSELPMDTQRVIFNFIFHLVLAEVDEGLAGNDSGYFFEAIDAKYEKSNEIVRRCYFCETTDVDAGLCLKCAMKIMEMKGVDLDGGKKQNH